MRILIEPTMNGRNVTAAASRSRQGGMTLIEVLIALMLMAIFAAAVISGFVSSTRANTTSNYAFAANLMAMQRVEQVRAARWDAVRFPVLDEVVNANFPPQVGHLNAEGHRGTPVWATNFTSITTVSTNPFIKMVRVDCVYSPDSERVVTNTIVSYRGTETGQQNGYAATVPLGTGLPSPPIEGTATNSTAGNFRDEGQDYDWDDDDDDGGYGDDDDDSGGYGDDDDDSGGYGDDDDDDGDRYGWGDWDNRGDDDDDD